MDIFWGKQEEIHTKPLSQITTKIIAEENYLNPSFAKLAPKEDFDQEELMNQMD